MNAMFSLVFFLLAAGVIVIQTKSSSSADTCLSDEPPWEIIVGVGGVDAGAQTSQHDDLGENADKSSLLAGVSRGWWFASGHIEALMVYGVIRANFEPTDGDLHVLNNKLTIGGRVRMNLHERDWGKIYDFGELEYIILQRNSLDDEVWGDLEYTNIVLGLGLRFKKVFWQAGISHPLIVQVDKGHGVDGKLGLKATTGYAIRANVTALLSYERSKFEGPDHAPYGITEELTHAGLAVAF